AFTCCWPELEEPVLLPQPTSEGGQPPPVSSEGGQPPVWPLALLPLGLYALWWIGKPRGGLRAVRAGLTRLHRHTAPSGVRERPEGLGGAGTPTHQARRGGPVAWRPIQHRPR